MWNWRGYVLISYLSSIIAISNNTLFFKYWIEVWLFQNRLTRKNNLYGGNLVIGWLYFKLENYLINWVGIFIELPVVITIKGFVTQSRNWKVHIKWKKIDFYPCSARQRKTNLGTSSTYYYHYYYIIIIIIIILLLLLLILLLFDYYYYYYLHSTSSRKW